MLNFLYKLKNKIIFYNHYNQITKNLKYINQYSSIDLLKSNNKKKRLIFKSFIQFKLQSKSRPILSLIIFELSSIMLLTPYIIFLLLNKIKKKENLISKNLALFKTQHENFIIPQELKENTKKLVMMNRKIYIENLKFIFDIFYISFSKGYYFNFQFLFKAVKELSAYYPVIKNNNFENAIVFLEFDCCISLLNFIYNKNKKSFINVQHGDQIISAHYSFVEVNKFYFWSKEYYKMFKKMKVKCKPFFFKKNNEKKIKKDKICKVITILEPQLAHFNYNKKKFNTFLNMLINAIKNIKTKNKIIFRYHPRYFEKSTIKLFLSNNIEIEDSTKISYVKCIQKSKIIIGTWSALLVDAALNDTKVAILNCDLVDVLKKYHYLFKTKNVISIKIENLKLNEI